MLINRFMIASGSWQTCRGPWLGAWPGPQAWASHKPPRTEHLINCYSCPKYNNIRALSCLVLPYLTLPYLILPYLTLPYLAWDVLSQQIHVPTRSCLVLSNNNYQPKTLPNHGLSPPLLSSGQIGNWKRPMNFEITMWGEGAGRPEADVEIAGGVILID